MQNNIAFISHGGGPLPLLGDPRHEEMVIALKTLSHELPKPKHIVVLSAHWESDVITITHSASPSLLFDYYGFPAQSYQFKYPVRGAPELAGYIANTLIKKGLTVELDDQRGLDHGVFVPLMLMYPDADIPVLQMSLSSSLDPLFHIDLGEALATLELSDILFLGSGFSFHNMPAFFEQSDSIRSANDHFENWLCETLLNQTSDYAEIKQRLINWHSAPGAQVCHPREEHLMPLHCCVGIAGRSADTVQRLDILDKRASSYVWVNESFNARIRRRAV